MQVYWCSYTTLLLTHAKQGPHASCRKPCISIQAYSRRWTCMARSPRTLPRWSSSELTSLKKTLVKNSSEVEWTGNNVKGKTGFVIISSPSVSVTVCLSLLLIIPEKGRGHWLHIWLFPSSSCSLTSICLCLAMFPLFPDLPPVHSLSPSFLTLCPSFDSHKSINPIFLFILVRVSVAELPTAMCKVEKTETEHQREWESRTQHLLTLQILLRERIEL